MPFGDGEQSSRTAGVGQWARTCACSRRRVDSGRGMFARVPFHRTERLRYLLPPVDVRRFQKPSDRAARASGAPCRVV